MDSPALGEWIVPRSGAKRGWELWKRFAVAFGRFQTRLILSLFYILMSPLSILVCLFSNSLALRKGISAWRARIDQGSSLKTARRQ